MDAIFTIHLEYEILATRLLEAVKLRLKSEHSLPAHAAPQTQQRCCALPGSGCPAGAVIAVHVVSHLLIALSIQELDVEQQQQHGRQGQEQKNEIMFLSSLSVQ